jgi:hypothetical protein
MINSITERWQNASESTKISFVVALLLVAAVGTTSTIVGILTSARLETVKEEDWGYSEAGQSCDAYCASKCTSGKCINKRMQWVKSKAVFKILNYSLKSNKRNCQGRPHRGTRESVPSYDIDSKECIYGGTDKIDFCSITPSSTVQHLCACNCKK